MTRWIALAMLAALISGCVADSGSDPASESATVASEGATIGDPEPGDPSDVAYVGWRDTGFTVIVSAEADALFDDVQTCTSEEGGYTVEFPSSWHTNEGGQAPGCSWFGPEPFAHAPVTLVALSRPVEVPIGIMVVRTGLGQIMEQPRLFSEVVTIAGFEGARTEDLIQPQPPWVSYGYSAWLDEDPTGLKLLAGTTSAADGDYVLNKAVLDRMMATFEFENRPEANTPEGVTYSEMEGYPFTVIESAEADTLFETPDTCTNPVAGYTVTFPDDWYTNTEIGDWPACTWFSPVFYSVGADENAVPPQIAIVITVFDGAFGQIGPYDTTLDEIVLVDGFDARRREQIGQETPAEGYRAHPPFYRYEVILAPQPAVAPTLTADTNFEGAADYELNKAVLDRIMALLVFENRPERVRYSEKEGYPFTVIENAEADQLFETPDTCTNPVAGYTVTFPDDWYTNTEIGETPACSWFTPDYFEVIDPAEAPDEIWISIDMVDGVVAYTSLTQIFLNEDVLLSGVTARRVESNPSPRGRHHYRAYDYHAIMGSQDQGPSFMAVVDSDAADDYELGKAVLDRIMASLQFDD